MSGNTTYYALPVKFDGTTACSSTADRVPFEVVYYEKPELIVPSPQPFEQCNNTVFDLVALQPSFSINAATETFEFFDSSGTLIASPSVNFYQIFNYQMKKLSVVKNHLQLLVNSMLLKLHCTLSLAHVIFLLPFLFYL